MMDPRLNFIARKLKGNGHELRMCELSIGLENIKLMFSSLNSANSKWR